VTSASVLEATQKSRPTDKRCRRTHHCRCCPCAIAHPAPGCRARPHRSRHNAGSACAWASAVALGRKMLVKTLPCNMLRRATRSVARKPRPAAAGQGAQCGSSVSDGTRRTKSRPRLLPSRQRSHKRRPRHGGRVPGSAITGWGLGGLGARRRPSSCTNNPAVLPAFRRSPTVQRAHGIGRGRAVFYRARKLGLEGIVSKRKDSDLSSRRSSARSRAAPMLLSHGLTIDHKKLPGK
jgi:hypothetical protein